jgi:hypothetical protein
MTEKEGATLRRKGAWATTESLWIEDLRTAGGCINNRKQRGPALRDWEKYRKHR